MDHNPSVVIRLAINEDTHAEGMSVHAGIGMTRWRRRKQMGGFESEFLIDTHGGRLGGFAADQGNAHGSPNSLCVCRLKRHLGWTRQ